MEARKAQEVALENTIPVIKETLAEFEKVFGRKYNLVEKYRTDDAEVLLLTMGSFSQTAMEAIDQMRDEGQKVGLVRIRLWRPFPFAEFRAAVKGAKVLAVLDRAVSLGGPVGPVVSEIKSALYPLENRPYVASFVGGLGGRDIYPSHFKQMVARAIELSKTKDIVEYEMIGVRE